MSYERAQWPSCCNSSLDVATPYPGSTASPLGSRRYSFGSTAAIVTSVGLIGGFGAAAVSRGTLVSGLLIIGLADNISDSLSIHIYQESENLESRGAFRATLTNFAARLLVVLSFVAIVMLLPPGHVLPVALGWGFALLATLTYVLARQRGIHPVREIVKHVVVAGVVVFVSRLLGAWLATHIH
jgi:VIT1/CCC1 family predicted Fe2+/Mn2+ transporter